MTPNEIPTVCFLDDVARILRMSRRKVEQLRRARTFPIQELPTLDSRPRWSGDAVRRFLATQQPIRRRLRRAG
jgi:hypothetical protein